MKYYWKMFGHITEATNSTEYSLMQVYAVLVCERMCIVYSFFDVYILYYIRLHTYIGEKMFAIKELYFYSWMYKIIVHSCIGHMSIIFSSLLVNEHFFFQERNLRKIFFLLFRCCCCFFCVILYHHQQFLCLYSKSLVSNLYSLRFINSAIYVLMNRVYSRNWKQFWLQIYA